MPTRYLSRNIQSSKVDRNKARYSGGGNWTYKLNFLALPQFYSLCMFPSSGKSWQSHRFFFGSLSSHQDHDADRTTLASVCWCSLALPGICRLCHAHPPVPVDNLSMDLSQGQDGVSSQIAVVLLHMFPTIKLLVIVESHIKIYLELDGTSC